MATNLGACLAGGGLAVYMADKITGMPIEKALHVHENTTAFALVAGSIFIPSLVWAGRKAKRIVSRSPQHSPT